VNGDGAWSATEGTGRDAARTSLAFDGGIAGSRTAASPDACAGAGAGGWEGSPDDAAAAAAWGFIAVCVGDAAPRVSMPDASREYGCCRGALIDACPFALLDSLTFAIGWLATSFIDVVVAVAPPPSEGGGLTSAGGSTGCVIKTGTSHEQPQRQER
jgi:hypothetical protein